MITLYRFFAAWDLPCISPFVTKVAAYLALAGLPFEIKTQDMSRLATDAPRGKLPYIEDSDGTKVPDSTEIISYLKSKYGDPLDHDLSIKERAEAIAWTRLIDEHLYWSGLIEPRWRMESGWQTFMPYFARGAEISPKLRENPEALRKHILSEFEGHGMGRRSSADVLAVFKVDIDALSDRLGAGPYFMGDKIRSIDATVYAMLIHILGVPFAWAGKDYALQKPNLVDYCARIKRVATAAGD
jgi:isoprene-epoxide---glutathione S-transferase